jgi:predicted nucleic acid-binding Zn ribbon protein
MEEPVKGTGEVRRMISGGAGLVFKGEGFYLTDYVRKKSSGGDDKGSNAPKASDTSTSTSSPSTSTTSNSSTSE